MIRIRGHHLLCIHGFQGMGYSESFVKEMEKITTILRDDLTNPELLIQVVNQLDDVCQGCPHNGKDKCNADENSNQHVMEMDQRVIKKLGIEANSVYTKKELLLRTQERVEASDLDVICEGCSWLTYGVCKEGIERLKRRELIFKL
ncbi:DUF1284 domain-containing protein [Tepidibacillus fermentans]|uniref:DUF1284 domain-containing protein n=1 Tax=Tepidibacillus fermentans TaxID=1281767 RepID=A0A4V2USS2_9BACI|nr:DUF1284 domain-containing protein [Tepidibacillus fermentans]TCS82542.1 hypothetical protein EDD72_10831 [Tepidibacillus fermentans]